MSKEQSLFMLIRRARLTKNLAALQSLDKQVGETFGSGSKAHREFRIELSSHRATLAQGEMTK